MPSSRSPWPSQNLSSDKGRATEFDLGFGRIAAALQTREHFTQQELARILDIRQSSVSDAKRRGVIPGEWVLKLFRQYRLNPLWVYEGLLPKFIAGLPGSPECSAAEAHENGLFNHEATSVLVASVSDASMEPLIRRDAFLGVNTTQRVLESGRIFGVDLPFEGLTFRRVETHKDGETCELVAENANFPRCRLPIPNVQDIVRGRVVWIMQKL